MHAQTFITRRPPSWKTSGAGAASRPAGLESLSSAAQFRPGRLTEEAPLLSVFTPLLLFYCSSSPSPLILSLLLVFSHTWTALLSSSSDDLFRTNLHFPTRPVWFSHSRQTSHTLPLVFSRFSDFLEDKLVSVPSSSPTGWACVSSSSSSSSSAPPGPPHWIFKMSCFHSGTSGPAFLCSDWWAFKNGELIIRSSQPF